MRMDQILDAKLEQIAQLASLNEVAQMTTELGQMGDSDEKDTLFSALARREAHLVLAALSAKIDQATDVEALTDLVNAEIAAMEDGDDKVALLRQAVDQKRLLERAGVEA